MAVRRTTSLLSVFPHFLLAQKMVGTVGTYGFAVFCMEIIYLAARAACCANKHTFCRSSIARRGSPLVHRSVPTAHEEDERERRLEGRLFPSLAPVKMVASTARPYAVRMPQRFARGIPQTAALPIARSKKAHAAHNAVTQRSMATAPAKNIQKNTYFSTKY